MIHWSVYIGIHMSVTVIHGTSVVRLVSNQSYELQLHSYVQLRTIIHQLTIHVRACKNFATRDLSIYIGFSS